MINKKVAQRITRLISLSLLLQLITPQHVETFALPLALTIPEVSVYVSSIAGALSASRYMQDMSTSLDEVARTMHDKLDSRWRSDGSPTTHHMPGNANTSSLHMLDTDFNQLRRSLEQSICTKKIETFCFPHAHRTMQVPHSVQQSVEQRREFNWHYTTEPTFKQAVDQEVVRCIKQLTYVNHPDVLTRACARLVLVYEQLHVPTYQSDFEQLKTTLLKYCFDRSGNLRTIELCNGMREEMCNFIKKLPEQYHHYQDCFPPLAQSGKRILKIGNIASSVTSQQANQEMCRVIEQLKAGHLVEAHLHAAKANHPLAQQLYQQGVNNIFEACKEDPHISSLSPTARAVLAKNAARLQEFYNNLLVRRELKEALCRAWHIPASAPHVVHEAVYKLCNLNEKGEVYFAQNNIIDHIELIIKDAHPHDRATLLEAFYLPNGLLKDRELHPGAQALEMPEAILHAEHTQQRTDLNKLFLIKELTKVDLERELATKGIACIKQGLCAEHSDKQKQYFDHAHASYETLLSRHTGKQEQLLAKITMIERSSHESSTLLPSEEKKIGCGPPPDEMLKGPSILITPVPEEETNVISCGGHVLEPTRTTPGCGTRGADVKHGPCIQPVLDEDQKIPLFHAKATVSDQPKAKEIPTSDQKPKTLDDILKDCPRGRETYGKAKQFEKEGNYDDALKDFESLKPNNIRDIGYGKVGQLADGRNVNVRKISKDGKQGSAPTLEVQEIGGKKTTKIRYRR